MLNANMRQTFAKPIAVVVEDLSRRGFKAQWPHRVQVGDHLWLRLPGIEPLAAKVVWTACGIVGCQFDIPLHPMILTTVVRSGHVKQIPA